MTVLISQYTVYLLGVVIVALSVGGGGSWSRTD